MSAATTTTRRTAKAGRPTVRAQAAPAPTTRQQARVWLADLATALNGAARADCPHLYSGESDRLLRMAYELTVRLANSSDAELDGPAGNEPFTVAALVKAALQVPGDCHPPERLAFIEQARAPLIGLTEDPTVLDGWETYPRTPTAAAEPAPGPTHAPAHPWDFLGAVLARVGEASAVLSVAVDKGGTDPVWGLVRLADWLTEKVQARVDGLDDSETPCSDTACDIACLMSLLNLVAEQEDEVLLYAAASILEVAASLCQSAQKSGHA